MKISKRFNILSMFLVATMCFIVSMSNTFADDYPMERKISSEWHWIWWPPHFVYRLKYQYKMYFHPAEEWFFEAYTHFACGHIVGLAGPYNEIGDPFPNWERYWPGWGHSGWLQWNTDPEFPIPTWTLAIFFAFSKWGYAGDYDTTQQWYLMDGGYWGEFYDIDDPCTEVFEDGGGYAGRFPSNYSVDYDFSTFSLAVGDESTNWITYDLGFEGPITHMSLASADIHSCFNPKEIEIAAASIPGSSEIDTVIGTYTFPALRNGEGYEISLFPGDDGRYVFTRYIRIRILSRWRGQNKPRSAPPRGARFAEVSFYGFPGSEDDDGKGKYTSSAQHDKDDSVTERSQIELHFDPVRTSTATIYYMVPRSDRLALSLYDVTGRLIQTLLNGEKEAGIHSINLSVGNLPDGVYFLRLKSGGEETVKKLILLK